MSEFYQVMQELLRDPKILQMKNYAQHKSSNTFNHSVSVAKTAYKLSKFFHLKVNEKSLAKGAMLHDFYLYDARGGQIGAWEHGTNHAETALKNSMKHYHLTDLEKDIIYCHMWPLNITRIPRSKECLLVSMADKYCATKELMRRKKKSTAA